MNKVSKPVFLSLIFLQACSGINAFQVFPMMSNAVLGSPDIPITDNFIADMEYSFAKVRIGRSTRAILTLAYINDGTYHWVSGDGESIYTLNGRIISTEGLIHNSYFLSPLYFPSISQPRFSSQQLLRVSNPDALLSQNSVFTTSLDDDSVNTYEVKEVVTTEGINWSFVNTFTLDIETGMPKKTTQYVHPRLKPLEIEFFYKF